MKYHSKEEKTAAIAIIAASALLLMTPMLAAAQEFRETPIIEKNSDFSLTATADAFGLGNVLTNIYLTSSGGTAELKCVRDVGKGGPPAKQVEFASLQGETITVQPRNGQIEESPSIGPPNLPDADELCPNPKWTVQIVSLTYFDVELHIEQGGSDVLTFDFGDVDP